MNTSSESHCCPKCCAPIPVEAPLGLCPKCLLMQVASPTDGVPGTEQLANQSDARARPGGERPAPPPVHDLASAFPLLEILELIGRGGMGFVYKARQPKLDRFVAIKILPGHLANEPSFHERFEREARVLARLQHPLIVSVYDFGEARISTPSETGSSFFYLMLEYVDGVNLREAMRAGKFTPEQALAIVPQVCEALQYAHSKGVLHRDIKPENILLDVEGHVKIADFGIAKALEPAFEPSSHLQGQASESEMAVTRLTATGSILGTPLYMAPEQLISPNQVDHRADIYSLGVVFYEMLTGELPMGRFAPPSEKSHVDQRIDEVVLRALAKERELRQQSANEMKTEVETITSSPRPSLDSPVPVSYNESHKIDSKKPIEDESTNHITTGALSGSPGWLALTTVFLGILLSLLPAIGLRIVGNISNEPFATRTSDIAFFLFVLLTVIGLLGPIYLGWSHLIRQRRENRRAGIIPALFAALILPFLFLDLAIFHAMTLLFQELEIEIHRRSTFFVTSSFIAVLCLIVDTGLFMATWSWATITPFPSRKVPATHRPVTSTDQTRHAIGVAGLVISVLFAVGWESYRSQANQLAYKEWWINEISPVQQELQSCDRKLEFVETFRNKEIAGRRSQLSERLNFLLKPETHSTRMTTFLPFALYALPFGLLGLILILHRGNLTLSVGAFVTSFAVAIAFNQRPIDSGSVHNPPKTKFATESLPLTESLPDIQISKPSPANDGTDPPESTRHTESLELNREQESSAASVAAMEAAKLGLIQVMNINVANESLQKVIALFGSEGGVEVEPYFSALVRMPVPLPELRWGGYEHAPANSPKGMSWRTLPVDYPCDYVACDWSDPKVPRIIGYMTPPGAYDFRFGTQTEPQLSGLTGGDNAEIASRALKLTSSETTTIVGVFDWQQAALGPHLRFKLVPKSLSKLDGPDECLIVLSEDSRSVLTRAGGRFTRHDQSSPQQIREFRDYLRSRVKPANTEAQDKAEVRELLDRAQQAMKGQDWDELLKCMTDDCRDEWICEIVVGQETRFSRGMDKEIIIEMDLALKALRKSSIKDLKSELDRFPVGPQLTPQENRRNRVQQFLTVFSDRRRAAVTLLSFVPKLPDDAWLVDFSKISNLYELQPNEVCGQWTPPSGGATIVVRRKDTSSPWLIHSLFGDPATLDPIFISAEEPSDDSNLPTKDDAHRSDAPVDALDPENLMNAPHEDSH